MNEQENEDSWRGGEREGRWRKKEDGVQEKGCKETGWREKKERRTGVEERKCLRNPYTIVQIGRAHV